MLAVAPAGVKVVPIVVFTLAVMESNVLQYWAMMAMELGLLTRSTTDIR